MSKVVSDHFDIVAPDYDYYKKKNAFYYINLKKLLGHLITKNKTVLEIGCGTGDLLASLRSKKGYGIDISPKMIQIAKKKHARRINLSFSVKDIQNFKNKKIDYVFMSDVIEHLPHPQKVFDQISNSIKQDTVFINTMANPIWEPILMIAEKLHLKMPEGEHHRYSSKQVIRMLKRAGFTILHHDRCLLLPKKFPILTRLANQFLEPHLKSLAFIEYMVCKKKS